MTFTVGLALECNIFSQENILDKLIAETKTAFRNDGIPGFVSFLIGELDRAICARLRSEPWGELHDRCLCKRCCHHPKIERAKVERKRIASTLGRLSVEWIRLRCRNCKTSFVPMRAVLGVQKYQSESQEFVKLACETVVEQSYRRSKKHLSKIGGIELTHTKLHRIVMSAECSDINPGVRGARLKYLIADGTGYPEFRPKSEKIGDDGDPLKPPKSEIKTVIGIDENNNVVPIGVWTRKGWHGVARAIQKANNHPRVKPKPIADILICDGEEALVRHMRKLTHEVQRCQWHVPHDFFALMRYQENAERSVAGEFTQRVHTAINVEAPAALGHTAPGVSQELERSIMKAENAIDELITELRIRTFRKAAVYLENAKAYLFTYLRYWLATGILPPKASSKIERLMREFKRRIKKIGFNWSAAGVAKITCILLKLIASEPKWEAEWSEKLGMSLEVSVRLKGVALVG
jgi:hypothetical protein